MVEVAMAERFRRLMRREGERREDIVRKLS